MGIFKTDGKAILGVFVGVIIAVVFMQTIADNIWVQTNTARIDNVTIVAPAVNATRDLTGNALISAIFVNNASNASSLNAQNVGGLILQTGTGTDGLQTVQLRTNDSALAFVGKNVNVTYTYQPDNYLDTPAARNMEILVLVMSALSVLVFAIAYFIKNGFLGELMRRG